MLYNSYPFLCGFLPLFLLGYFLLPAPRLALRFAVLASLAFYSYWNPTYLPLLLVSMVFNFGLGRVILQHRPTHLAYWLTSLGVASNLLLLGYYKYSAFAAESLGSLFGYHLQLQPPTLPLGISFFTFEQVGYLVDAYAGQAAAYTPTEYAFFVSFFPHLIAGPIIVHRELLAQLNLPKVLNFCPQNLAIGLTLFGFGLAKKVLLADYFAEYANLVFAPHPTGLASADAWLGVLSYSLQLYFDFSGYSDMGLGLAKMINLRLPMNFDSPYQASSIIDFWRRWHITLSRFLRDYLYIALGGNRFGTTRRYVNLLLTMLLGGLWHGAGWNFVVWGGLHGMYLVINHVWRGLVPPQRSWLWQQMCILLTFVAVMVAWVFFRATSLTAAQQIVGAMWLGGSGPLLPQHTSQVWLWALLGYGWVRFLPNSQQLLAHFSPCLQPVHHLSGWGWRLTPVHAAVAGLLTSVALLHLGRVSEFLYFQF